MAGTMSGLVSAAISSSAQKVPGMCETKPKVVQLRAIHSESVSSCWNFFSKPLPAAPTDFCAVMRRKQGL